MTEKEKKLYQIKEHEERLCKASLEYLNSQEDLDSE